MKLVVIVVKSHMSQELVKKVSALSNSVLESDQHLEFTPEKGKLSELLTALLNAHVDYQITQRNNPSLEKVS